MSKETWFSVFDHKIQVIIMLQIKSLRAENCGLSQGFVAGGGWGRRTTHTLIRDDDLLLVSDAKHIIRVKGKGLHKKCPKNGEDECMEKPPAILFPRCLQASKQELLCPLFNGIDHTYSIPGYFYYLLLNWQHLLSLVYTVYAFKAMFMEPFCRKFRHEVIMFFPKNK